MLRALRDLEGYSVAATDGDIGRVVDFLLDDKHWAVRYLVVETGGFFDGRRVLVSPISFGRCDWVTRHFHVSLTKDAVKGSPSVDLDRPVSRQHEADLLGYYGYPLYWGFPAVWGFGAFPGMLAGAAPMHLPAKTDGGPPSDSHLRSAREVRGYHIRGTDGTIGHVDDFTVDVETWQVRYLVVDTSNWWMGKKVLVAPHWASSVNWGSREVHVDISREAVRSSPERRASDAMTPEDEALLYAHYGRPVHWQDAARVVL